MVEALRQLKKKVGGGKFFLPKDENALSDYVQRYLKQELGGVIVSREIQVRRGDFADIHLSTFTTDQDERKETNASVAIEVKGSWNQEWDTALEDQLAGQYLTSPECRHGVYFVGWHYGSAWYEDDYRKSRARRGGIENLRRKLQAQAESVSHRNVFVRSVVADLSLPS